MNSRTARAIVAAYLAGKARDALRTHVGASLFRDHVKRSLGEHPEGADVSRLRQAMIETANELARRGNIEPPFAGEPVVEPDPTPQPEPEATHAPTHHARRRTRRRIRG